MREKEAELASFVLIGVMLASIFAGAVSGAGVGVGGAEEIDVCVIPTDDLYINEDTTLCPGTYYVNDANNDGVIIFAANNVKLTCDNTVLIGDDSGKAIVSNGYDGITIEGCTLNNYHNAISVNGYSGFSDKCLIRNNIINGSNNMGISWRGDNNMIENNIIDDYTGDTRFGIHISGRWADSSRSNIIRNNIITNMDGGNGHGIVLSLYSSYNYVTNNILTNNAGSGILIDFSSSNKITSNIANYNQKGLYFTADSENNVVNHNIFCDNSVYDIEDRGENTGDENTCDRPGGWNDAGTTGCTNVCSNGKHILDQYQEGINYGFWFEKTFIRWQEFKPTHTSLSQIDLYIRKNGKPGNMRVSITNDAEDQLWETTVSGEKIAKSKWIEIPVDPSISLKPDDSYYIYVWSDADSPGPDNRYFWKGETKSEYDRGISCVEDRLKGYDFAFRTWGSGGCVDFEDPLLGTTFHVKDVFTDSGAKITVQPFQWSNNKWTTDGYAVIGNDGLAGGSGQEIWVNNVNLDFDFGSPCSGISLLFGEYGGNLNIDINGDFRNFEDFVDINGLNIGGVNVLVVNGFGNDKGSLKLSGTINSLVIGGQELCIDDVCPGAPGEMPDLIVTLNGPEKVIAGEDVALEVIVSNIGSATAPGSIDVEYRKAYHVDLILSSDSDIPLKSAVRPAYAGDFVEDMLLEGGRISRTVSIPPGGYANYTLNLYIPKNASPGIYCLGAVVDPAKAVDELNEDNNTYCHKINILPPEMAPTEPPAGVDFYVMPYAVGGTPLYNINDSGLTDYADIVDAPFGSRLGFRHVYDSRIPTEEIMYYRWLYKDESEKEWHEFTETVVVHYEKKEDGVLTFPVYTLGPKGVNGMNLYEFKPHSPPESGTFWPATDGFGDIYSGFLNSEAISDGKYKIKLEIYDKKGNQVIPANSTFKFIVPTGVDANGTIHTRNATSEEIDNGGIDNGGFVFSLHIDNRKCSAVIDAPSIGTTSMADECGFLRYTPADETVHIAFHATHPDNFAIFTFSIIRGTKEIISANGEVSAYSVGDFSSDGNGNFKNESSRTKLLEECPEAAFSENLYVYAKATTGWGHRIYGYDAHAVRAFALSPI